MLGRRRLSFSTARHFASNNKMRHSGPTDVCWIFRSKVQLQLYAKKEIAAAAAAAAFIYKYIEPRDRN
jgi:hypothetical protein